MKQSVYEDEIRKVLDGLTEKAILEITELLKNIPEKAKGLEFEIFPSQDSDGVFDIQASLDGPDLFVLNKSIEDYAKIVDTVHTPNGLEPNFPLIDPDSVEFEVNDVVVDIAASWLNKLWDRIDTSNIDIPNTIFGHDEYGTITPVELN